MLCQTFGIGSNRTAALQSTKFVEKLSKSLDKYHYLYGLYLYKLIIQNEETQLQHKDQAGK